MTKKFLCNVGLICLLMLCIRPAAANVSLLILGDSLSAGYGLSEADTWVAEIQREWEDKYPEFELINASISGDTTQGALNRLEGVVERHEPDAVFVELGGNDGLRGFRLTSMRDNLDEIIRFLHERGIYVALSAIEIPPNMGARYSRQFRDVYDELAEAHDIPLVPFFMREIATDESLMQSDGIHPNLEAQSRIADIMEPRLREILEQVQTL